MVRIVHNHDTNNKGVPIAKPRTKYGKYLRNEAHEVMRERIKGQNHITQVTKIAKRLQAEYKTLTVTEIAALKASADVQFKILNKILPDLKATEKNVNVKVDDSNLQEMSTDQLKKIVYAEYNVIEGKEIKDVNNVSESG